jgi:hypothetical protein
MVGYGLVCSRNLIFILHLYLVFGGNLINCYKLYKSANSPAALISVTNEANVVKIQNIKISRQRFTVKRASVDCVVSDTTWHETFPKHVYSCLTNFFVR